MLPMAVQLSGALHILTRAYHANNAIIAFIAEKGLSSLENTHFCPGIYCMMEDAEIMQKMQ